MVGFVETWRPVYASMVRYVEGVETMKTHVKGLDADQNLAVLFKTLEDNLFGDGRRLSNDHLRHLARGVERLRAHLTAGESSFVNDAVSKEMNGYVKVLGKMQNDLGDALHLEGEDLRTYIRTMYRKAIVAKKVCYLVIWAIGDPDTIRRENPFFLLRIEEARTKIHGSMNRRKEYNRDMKSKGSRSDETHVELSRSLAYALEKGAEDYGVFLHRKRLM
jgi:hypothetical protein